MPAGRPSKPTAQKKLEGTTRADRSNEAEPVYPALLGLEPPPWLDKLAREHWSYFAPLLSKMRVLTAADVTLLTAASERWSVYQRAAALLKRSVRGRKLTAGERLRLAEQEAAVKQLESEGIIERTRGKLRRGMAPEGNELPAAIPLLLDARLLGEYVVPPQHSIASQALRDYMGIMREFGIGPASRSKVAVDPPENDDPFEEAFG